MKVLRRSIPRALAAVVVLSGTISVARADGLAGPYLAGMQANFRSDYSEAARYFAQAVISDPDNPFLLQNAIINNIASGNFEPSVEMAKDLRKIAEDAQLAGLVLVADAVKREDFGGAAELLEDEVLRLNPLMARLLEGWVAAGSGNISEAGAKFDALASDSSFGALGQYHKALMLAWAGNFDGALQIMEGTDGKPLRVNRVSARTHAEILVQLGRPDDAISVIEAESSIIPGSDLDLLRMQIENDEEIPFEHIRSPLDGAAEVFLTLATALNQEEAAQFAILYSRLAQHVRPDYADAQLLTADLLESQGQYDLAIAEYDGVPSSSPLFKTAQIGRADALSSAERTDMAISVLEDLTQKYPEDRFVRIALGDLFRTDEQYANAASAYSDALRIDDGLSIGDWRTYYVRGIAYERLDDWDKAETDFRTSLDLSPDQPLVLNYLGYSLVEKRMKIDQAKDMIERAVAARPDDGYITDSLGWVLYRLGDFEGAVPHLERAAELMPTDPIINDHLGDAFWMVGRKLEAEFQWRRALSFEPEDADAERIRRKLEVGLDVVLAEEDGDGQTE